MNKVLDSCPVCKGTDLVQETMALLSGFPKVVGGPSTSRPGMLTGSHCNDCGTKFIFSRKGECPECEGSGKYTYITSVAGTEVWRSTLECPVCTGKGQIG